MLSASKRRRGKTCSPKRRAKGKCCQLFPSPVQKNGIWQFVTTIPPPAGSWMVASSVAPTIDLAIDERGACIGPDACATFYGGEPKARETCRKERRILLRAEVGVFRIGHVNPINGQSSHDNKSLPIKQFQLIQRIATPRGLVHGLLNFMQACLCFMPNCVEGDAPCRL